MRFRLIITLVLVILMAGCGTQTTVDKKDQGERFQQVSTDRQGTIYVDTHSINVNANKTIASVWMKMVYSAEGLDEMKKSDPDKLGNLQYILFLDEIQIGNRKMRNVDVVPYDKSGNVININKPPSGEGQWDNVVPNTNGEKLYDLVMNKLRADKVIK